MTTTASPKNTTVGQVMKTALGCFTTGQLDRADNLLKQVTTAAPKHPAAWHLWGVVTHQLGNTPQAIKYIEKAIKLDGSVSEFHRNLAELLRIEKKIHRAVAHATKAVKLDPENAKAHAQLGACLFSARKLKHAEKHFEKALTITPDLLQAINGLGGTLKDQHKPLQAIPHFRRSLQINPKDKNTLNNLGSILAANEDTREEGLTYLHRAIAIDPDFFEGYYNLGVTYEEMSDFNRAKEAFNEALKIEAKNVNALLKLAEVYRTTEELDKSEQTILHAIEIEPKRPQLHIDLARIYAQMNYREAAKAALRKAFAVQPKKTADMLIAKGNILLELGEMEPSKKSFLEALSISPGNISAMHQLAYAAKVKPDDENFLALKKLYEKKETLPFGMLININFALGKCYEDIKEYRTSFIHFMEGCKLKRQTFKYDPNSHSKYVDHLIHTFNKTYIKKWSGFGNPSDVPIFVVGMPRSGTTLTEQIIASHPKVYGAGELRDLMSLISSTGKGSKSDVYTQSWVHPTKQMFTTFGYIYLEQVKLRAPKSPHITDKMPANFLGVGLIHLALPNAKIIHIKRNPLDTCISGFSKLFGNGQYHSYDLAESGQYYYDYARLMDHWKKVLPEGAFLEVQYEELIADTEGQAKRIIDYCGLEWNDACLNFHQNKRSVRTASITQVRQPIYKSSLARWKHYEEFLWPLRNALKEYNPKDDAEEIGES